MRLLMLAGTILGLSVTACGDDGGGGTQDTRQDSTAETAAETTAETVAETTAETAAEAEAAPANTTWDDVYPIFAASCTPCHASNTPNGGPSGGHSIGSPNKAVAYQASQRSANILKCAGKKIGECAILRIQDGSMPATGACQEPKTAQCPDVDEQGMIQAWIDDGMLEN